jgi:hypothetical protein
VQHRHLLDDLFGPDFLDEELVPRMVATTRNSRESAEMKLDNMLAYLQARATLTRVDCPLVCNLGPDEAWHVFILYTFEYTEFCNSVAGEYIHHDPAGEAALVNKQKATERTIARMKQNGIAFDEEMWQDHIVYPRGARAIRSGFMPRMSGTVVARIAAWRG